MHIRTAEKKDYPYIYQLVKTAFETAEVHDGNEQDFVYQLRAPDKHIPELEMVLEDNGELIGHIMLTKLCLIQKNRPTEALLAAPLCIKLEYRGRGWGGKLLTTALQKAETLRYSAVFLVGNPDYYGRFGFRQTGVWNIKNESAVPDRYVLGRELVSGALKDGGILKII